MPMSESFAAVLPEIVLAVGAMALLMLGAFGRPDGNGSMQRIGGFAILLMILTGIAVVGGGNAQAFDGVFITDAFARFLKLLILAGSGVAILLALDDFKRSGTDRFEVPVLVVLATVGMMMMVSANDLIALYIGLELQSLALYVLAAIRRDDVRSSEAGLKYFVLGALSSGMLLYGASLLYGFTGTTSFAGLAEAAAAPGAATNIGLIAGLVFLLVGLAFKVSAVPFHMWTPDVYEGAPTPITAFFAAAPKLAAMALLVRVLYDGFGGMFVQWQKIVVFLAIASMLLGAFAAIGQTNIKRLMAYSSIGHVGFALVGLAAGSAEGVQSLLVYLAIYLVMTLGSFAVILSMRRDEGPVEDIDELAGLAQTNLPMAFVLAMLLFSLAGVPPLAGFFAKFYVLAAAVKAELYGLAIVGVLASVVGAFYYLRIIKIMFFDEARPAFAPAAPYVHYVMMAAGLFVLFYAVYPAPLVDAAAAAAQSLRP
ncbi:NADH:ubiquinone oxidoreductase subunit N [Hyphomicrobium nitrativorans NL23]|uniref:NADH-quinone oxidoreductase subunit N n=1 Tax=Hyphomicrobium nitrativorans NL23 TaxID=1029756 RepID=V5SGD4_9HYPH|nr:NADH-quinone oxidoreductase subunit NuoN [Hyphomicrobium nitrativorans]AHB49562.1 NADH:ubiquinone oxidoreductase subunit N [Hyphomicrobium nitrativorans NL23]